jgi:hypothetical protein
MCNFLSAKATWQVGVLSLMGTFPRAQATLQVDAVFLDEYFSTCSSQVTSGCCIPRCALFLFVFLDVHFSMCPCHVAGGCRIPLCALFHLRMARDKWFSYSLMCTFPPAQATWHVDVVFLDVHFSSCSSPATSGCRIPWCELFHLLKPRDKWMLYVVLYVHFFHVPMSCAKGMSYSLMCTFPRAHVTI